VPAGKSFRVTGTLRNAGRAAAPRSTTGYYLSRDQIRGRGDRLLARRSASSLAPGTTARQSVTMKVPTSTPARSYRVLACADDRHRVTEAKEQNNCRASTRTVRVTLPAGDQTPPTFAGLKAATTCIPGPIGPGRTGSYRLTWDPASDNVTPVGEIVYDIYQATASAGEDFSAPTYTTMPGAASFDTTPLASTKTYYFVVRARDQAGNRDPNKVERKGENLCV
jgi:hypothetical protein